MTKTIGIVLFPDVEELDFVGPLEVFGALGKYFDKLGWRVVTVAENGDPLKGIYGLEVKLDHNFDDCPPLEVLLVPGGPGYKDQEKNQALLDFVERAGNASKWVTSVCTGAFILYWAGFLEHKRATTHWAAIEDLRKLKNVTVVADQRYVEDGNVITSAGVSAGIDMALHLVDRLEGREVALGVQKVIEYYPEPPFSQEPVAISGKETH